MAMAAVDPDLPPHLCLTDGGDEINFYATEADGRMLVETIETQDAPYLATIYLDRDQRLKLIKWLIKQTKAMVPDGLCPDRSRHPSHPYTSATLGAFWCTGDPDDREPERSERRRRELA